MELRAINSKLIILSFILFCNLIYSQSLFDESILYESIGQHFKDKDTVLLLNKTVDIKRDINFLKKPYSWDEGNYTIENSKFENINFNKIFSRQDLIYVVCSLKNNESVLLRPKDIPKNISLLSHEIYDNLKKTKYKISSPVVVQKENQKYIFMYVESIQNGENGYGAIYLYVKEKNNWEHIYTYGLWIS